MDVILLKWLESDGRVVSKVTGIYHVLLTIIGKYVISIRHRLWQTFILAPAPNDDESVSADSSLPFTINYCPPFIDGWRYGTHAKSAFTVGEGPEWTVCIRGAHSRSAWFVGLARFGSQRFKSDDSIQCVSTRMLYMNSAAQLYLAYILSTVNSHYIYIYIRNGKKLRKKFRNDLK